MSITVPEAVKQMLAIVERLCKAYPKKKFSLDGRLVGDIGEVLVEDAYELTLFEDIKNIRTLNVRMVALCRLRRR